MAGHIYGYISETESSQPLETLRERMRASGAADDTIVTEAPSKTGNRPRLKKLLRRLRPGDTLIVESIYGLGCNYNSVFNNLNDIHQAGGISIVLLDMPLLSERSMEDPLRPVVSEMVTQTILYVIQHHKELRQSLQRRGIDSAKARGVQFGRPTAELPSDYDSVVQLWRNGEITAEEAAQTMHISRSTFFRRVKSDTLNQ